MAKKTKLAEYDLRRYALLRKGVLLNKFELDVLDLMNKPEYETLGLPDFVYSLLNLAKSQHSDAVFPKENS